MRALQRFLILLGLGITLSAFGASAHNKTEADILFNTNQVLQLKIDIPPSGMRSLRREPRRYVPASIREGDRVYTNMLVHLRGSVGSFRPVDDKPGLTFKIEKGSPRFHGLKKFHFNNSAQDSTYLSEWVCNEIFRSAGVPSTRVAHAFVELNGRPLGLYLLKEAFNDDFLERYFQNADGNLYGQPGNADVTVPMERVQGKGENTHADLKALARAAQERDPSRCWQQLQQVLDVDRFLSFMALETMLCHWDGYTYGQHNFRVYHDLDTGKMVFFPHDMDQMMGDPNASIIPHPSSLVAQAVLRTQEGRARYRERVGLLFTNVLQPEPILSRIDTYVSAVTPSIQRYDQQFATHFRRQAERLKARVVQRAAGIERQITPLTPLRFEGNFARLKGWRILKKQGDPTLETVVVEGLPVLKIRCEGDGCAASWRASVTLEPGRYRFSGRVRALGIVPQPETPTSGGFLRVSGSRGKAKDAIVGDRDWSLVTHDFSVDETQPAVVLVGELHALEGEIWFDRDSLRLQRLP